MQTVMQGSASFNLTNWTTCLQHAARIINPSAVCIENHIMHVLMLPCVKSDRIHWAEVGLEASWPKKPLQGIQRLPAALRNSILETAESQDVVVLQDEPLRAE